MTVTCLKCGEKYISALKISLATGLCMGKSEEITEGTIKDCNKCRGTENELLKSREEEYKESNNENVKVAEEMEDFIEEERE